MRTTAEETEQTTQIIIDAAIKVFSEKGYEATNMQDIADSAKISRGPLYYRFKTKSALYQAALSTNCEREYWQYKRIFDQDKYILDLIREDLYYCTRGLRVEQPVFPAMAPSDPNLKAICEIYKTSRRNIFSIKEAAVKRAIERGELKADTNPTHIVNLLFVFFDGLEAQMQPLGFSFSSQEIEDAIEDLIHLLSQYCTK